MGRHRRTYTDKELKIISEHLGKMPDTEISEKTGIPTSTLYLLRKRRGIPAFSRNIELQQQPRILFWNKARATRFLQLWTSGKETTASIINKMHLEGISTNIHYHIKNLRLAGWKIPRRKKLRYFSACYSCEFCKYIPRYDSDGHGIRFCNKYDIYKFADKMKVCHQFKLHNIKNKRLYEKVITEDHTSL